MSLPGINASGSVSHFSSDDRPTQCVPSSARRSTRNWAPRRKLARRPLQLRTLVVLSQCMASGAALLKERLAPCGVAFCRQLMRPPARPASRVPTGQISSGRHPRCARSNESFDTAPAASHLTLSPAPSWPPKSAAIRGVSVPQGKIHRLRGFYDVPLHQPRDRREVAIERRAG
jgi:hypothetical protein